MDDRSSAQVCHLRLAVVHAKTMECSSEIMTLCDKNNWQVITGIEFDKPGDISDIERLLNPPKPEIKAITIARNEPCPCGSGKKYKQCCLN